MIFSPSSNFNVHLSVCEMFSLYENVCLLRVLRYFSEKGNYGNIKPSHLYEGSWDGSKGTILSVVVALWYTSLVLKEFGLACGWPL